MQIPNAPLYRDPIHDGAADPTIIWNPEEQAWWMLYTNRRADAPGSGHAWVHGTDIGVASSTDGGKTWLYRGVLPNLAIEPGRNTFWAPEVLLHEGIFHMYVSYVRGVPDTWDFPRSMLHYTSRNLWDWQFESRLSLSSERVIDACVYRMPDQRWRMLYKDENHESQSFAADSDDLFHWRVVGPVVMDCAHEGPNVFRWKDRYWLVTDFWRGLGVYHSDDGISWTRQADILDKPGVRNEDGAFGHHADVLVQGERAFLFYFTHPCESSYHAGIHVAAGERKRSSIQVAELEIRDGVLVCDRDKPFDFRLLPGE